MRVCFFFYQVEGGQAEGEVFVRMLYNGRVVRPNFCQRDECPIRTYKSHVMQFLLPENLEVSCVELRFGSVTFHFVTLCYIT